MIYYSVADFFISLNGKQLEKSERELVGLSDLVFATCSELATAFTRRQLCTPFPPGVDISAFPEETTSDTQFDQLGLSKLPRPIIGYIGGLHRFVDYDLIAALATARPSWSWVFLELTRFRWKGFTVYRTFTSWVNDVTTNLLSTWPTLMFAWFLISTAGK